MLIRVVLAVLTCALASAAAPPSFAADMPAGRFASPPMLHPILPGTDSMSVSMPGMAGAHPTGQAVLPAGRIAPEEDVRWDPGFNAQYGNFVFGLEGDVSGNWMRDSNSSGTGICAAPGCAIQTSWFATARGRVGYAFDRALFYVTAGGAFGDVQMLTNGLTATADRAGWTAGVGLEYAILGPWSAKVEYLYADLGDATCGVATCGVATCGIDTTVSFKTSIVRFGVNYTFW